MDCVSSTGQPIVHLYRVVLEQVDAEWAASALSPDEQLHAAGFRFERDRRSFVRARGVLRHALARRSGTEPRSIRFEYNGSGKPSLPQSDLHFNLSHSDGTALMAFAEHSLGVDLERVTENLEWEGIASQFFSREEQELIASHTPAARAREFLRNWTRREAYVKARGTGDPSMVPTPTARVIDDSGRAWSVQSLEPFVGTIAAIACQCEAFAVHIEDWRTPQLG